MRKVPRQSTVRNILHQGTFPTITLLCMRTCNNIVNSLCVHAGSYVISNMKIEHDNVEVVYYSDDISIR